MEILKHETTGKNKGRIEIKFENELYVVDYIIDSNNNFHFEYKDNKKPNYVDLEYYIICNI